jgi:hypothetical protein
MSDESHLEDLPESSIVFADDDFEDDNEDTPDCVDSGRYCELLFFLSILLPVLVFIICAQYCRSEYVTESVSNNSSGFTES